MLCSIDGEMETLDDLGNSFCSNTSGTKKENICCQASSGWFDTVTLLLVSYCLTADVVVPRP